MDRDRNGFTYIRRHEQIVSSNSNNVDGRTSMPPREPLNQHDELIRYIKEAWHKVVNEPSPHAAPIIYKSENDQSNLKNFKAFDLDTYWGKRHIENLHVTPGHQ